MRSIHYGMKIIIMYLLYVYKYLYIDCIFTPCNVPKYQELHGRKVIMCLSLNQSVALMPSCIDVTILCRNNINQYSLYASKLSAGTIFIKGQYSSLYMAQKRNLFIFNFKIQNISIFIIVLVEVL